MAGMKTRIALNTELTLQDGNAPEWVELIPAGPEVVGNDGRRWLFDQQAQQWVTADFGARAQDFPLDWEHATQLRAPKGEEAPAAAWITELDIRDGALWGRTVWTQRGGTQVANREYRYLSPVFDFDPATGRIVRLVSAGLSNKPNLTLTALNSEQQEKPVALAAVIALALGVPADATDEQALTAINALKTTAQARNSEQPSLERFVPRADYDALQTRATNAEQALAANKQAELAKAVDAALDAASAAGKITPATRDYHRAMCSDQAGLERFQAFVGAAPVIAPDSNLDERKPTATTTALNSEQQAMCAQLGVDPAEFIKTLNSEA
ncbi:Mu-like prophage I protein [compost metagenome]